MRRRDRHARTAHPDTDGRRRPPAGFRLRSGVSFERVVRDALAEMVEPVSRALEGVPVATTDVPEHADGSTPVVTVHAEGRRIRRVLVHRRSAEQRAADRVDLIDVVRDALEQEVLRALGLDPEQLD